MVRLLAISDVVDEGLRTAATRLRPDLVVACGDLPFEYVEHVMTVANAPLVYVPGNHDPDLRRRRSGEWPPSPPEHRDADPPGPRGGTNVDAVVVEEVGLRLAGLGGSHRYRDGPNQYSQREMRRRVRSLVRRSRWRRPRGRSVDVLVTHAPPAGVGDDDDLAHVGFDAFHDVYAALRPSVHLHGHVHPHEGVAAERRVGSTRVVNVIPYRVLEV
ncbi:MAG TPA: metallophosphoesterase [Actinomycetota bacterium]|nr:metallophosphoesterase [Actinomycetota bacterium]